MNRFLKSPSYSDARALNTIFSKVSKIIATLHRYTANMSSQLKTEHRTLAETQSDLHSALPFEEVRDLGAMLRVEDSELEVTGGDASDSQFETEWRSDVNPTYVIANRV